MKVSGLKNCINFGRALTRKEEVKYASVLDKAQKKLGIDGGKQILIVHEPCLPSISKNNVGYGNISSDEALDFFKFMKKYTGVNSVELLPSGIYRAEYGGSLNVNPYGASSFGLGEQEINLKLLLGDEFSNILKQDEFDEVVRQNKLADLSNIDILSGENSPVQKALKKAYDRFLKTDGSIISEFEKFKKENSKMLEEKSLYSALAKENNQLDWRRWSELDKNLLELGTDEAKNRIKHLKEIYKDDFDFFAFKQFLAEKSFFIGKKRLNKEGLDLIGDCLIGFSKDEVWANKSAFRIGEQIGWGLPAIDYTKFKKSDGTLGVAGELLKKKFEHYLKLYDGIRFDVGWSYVNSPHSKIGENDFKHDELGSSVLNLIEETAKKIKGEDFDLKKLMYETEAGGDCGAISWHGSVPVQKPAFKNRTKIYTTSYMNTGWGSSEFFKKSAGFSDDEFVLGVGNHDSISLKSLAEGVNPSRKAEQVSHLADFFRQTREFLSNPVNFIKAKNAEIFNTKNRMHFYMDVFGRDETFNPHGEDKTFKSFRYKIPENYMEEYHRSLQKGEGLNVMDSLSLMFKKRGLDEAEPKLYKQIEKFSDILKSKDEVIDNSFGIFKKIKNPYIIASVGLFGASLIFLAKKITAKKPVNTVQNVNIKFNEKENNIFEKFIRK